MVKYRYCRKCKMTIGRHYIEIPKIEKYRPDFVFELKGASDAALGLEKESLVNVKVTDWGTFERNKRYDETVKKMTFEEINRLRRKIEELENTHKTELDIQYERGKYETEQEFKNRYGIPGNKSLIDHMLNQRRNLDILQRKYEKLQKAYRTLELLCDKDFRNGLESGHTVKINR